jgi:hypothetical protein
MTLNYLRFDEVATRRWQAYANQIPQDTGGIWAPRFRAIWGIEKRDAFATEPAKLAASVWMRKVYDLRGRGRLTDHHLDNLSQDILAWAGAKSSSKSEQVALILEGLKLLCCEDVPYNETTAAKGKAQFEERLKQLSQAMKAVLANKTPEAVPPPEEFYVMLYRVLKKPDAEPSSPSSSTSSSTLFAPSSSPSSSSSPSPSPSPKLRVQTNFPFKTSRYHPVGLTKRAYRRRP